LGKILALAVGPLWPASGGVPEFQAPQAARVDTFRVVKAYPHDGAEYTQGREVRRVTVTDRGVPVRDLNELEMD
jgi:glutamine cyclotransferase